MDMAKQLLECNAVMHKLVGTTCATCVIMSMVGCYKQEEFSHPRQVESKPEEKTYHPLSNKEIIELYKECTDAGLSTKVLIGAGFGESIVDIQCEPIKQCKSEE